MVAQGGSISVEASLVDYVRRGEKLDLIPSIPEGKKIDQNTMRSWRPCQTISATVIRDILRGRLVTDPDPRGLRLRGARITGRLDLENLVTEVWFELADCLLEEGVAASNARLASVVLTGCQLEHSTKPPLTANRLTCGELSLNGATVIGHTKAGAVTLNGAHIGGQLACIGADLRNDAGPALAADGLQVDADMLLLGEFTATGHGEGGAVRLYGAHIGGQLACAGASLGNDSGPALYADGLQVGLGMIAHRPFTATGHSADGAVRLVRAHISGLDCTGASLGNDSGPALAADGLQVDSDMLLRDGFTATGHGTEGAVRLPGAHIGRLDCSGADLGNDSGSALIADSLQVGQDMLLTDGFTATGHGDGGAVRLDGAHIGGQLDCTGASLGNDSGPALIADSLQVGQDMIFHMFTATGGGEHVVVGLPGARVDGAFWFAPVRLEHAADPRWRLWADGLTYAGVPKPASDHRWLPLLRGGTPGYAAQPYQQLAAGCRAQGHEREARQVLMAQRDDELTRTGTHWSERLWGKITKLTLGYGYQPWRALVFLAGVVALSCVLAVVLGWHGALAQAKDAAAPGQPCTVMQRVSVGLDLNLPIGASLARAGCGLPKNAASATAAWLTGVGWVLRVLAWTFAALFIAGFTSAVRKT